MKETPHNVGAVLIVYNMQAYHKKSMYAQWLFSTSVTQYGIKFLNKIQ